MMTPREEAAALLKNHGLERALAIARARLDGDRRLRLPIDRHLAIIDVLEPLANAVATLKAIEQSDPVADLAASLIAQGYTKHEVFVALGPSGTNLPLGNEFYNKFCDIALGVPTQNRYKIRREI